MHVCHPQNQYGIPKDGLPKGGRPGECPVRLQSDDSRVTCQYPSNGKKLFSPRFWCVLCTVESNRLTTSRTIHEHVDCSLFFFFFFFLPNDVASRIIFGRKK